ncbi:hypothetical protein ROZALSC1DRAFT_26558, partial [Rozella allomycis CSF55]
IHSYCIKNVFRVTVTMPDGTREDLVRDFDFSIFKKPVVEYDTIRLDQMEMEGFYPGTRIEIEPVADWYYMVRLLHDLNYDILWQSRDCFRYLNFYSDHQDYIPKYEITVPFHKAKPPKDVVALEVMGHPKSGPHEVAVHVYILFKVKSLGPKYDSIAKITKMRGLRVFDLTKPDSYAIFTFSISPYLLHRVRNDRNFLTVKLEFENILLDEGSIAPSDYGFNHYNQMIADEYFECKDFFVLDNKDAELYCTLNPRLRYALAKKFRFALYTGKNKIQELKYDFRLMYQKPEYLVYEYDHAKFHITTGPYFLHTVMTQRPVLNITDPILQNLNFKCPKNRAVLTFHENCMVNNYDGVIFLNKYSEVNNEKLDEFLVPWVLRRKNEGKTGCFQYVCPDIVQRDSNNQIQLLLSPHLNLTHEFTEYKKKGLSFDWGKISVTVDLGDIYNFDTRRSRMFIIDRNNYFVQPKIIEIIKKGKAKYKITVSLEVPGTTVHNIIQKWCQLYFSGVVIDKETGKGKLLEAVSFHSREAMSGGKTITRNPQRRFINDIEFEYGKK